MPNSNNFCANTERESIKLGQVKGVFTQGRNSVKIEPSRTRLRIHKGNFQKHPQDIAVLVIN